jgi:hypothetical protein
MSSETKFILGLMAGVGSLIVFMVSQSPIWHLKSAFLLGGGCALLVRSFLPMLTLRRGVAAWFGGGFAAMVVLGITFIVLFSDGKFGLGTQEAITFICLGLPLSFFLLKSGYRISFSNKELAEFEFKKAVKLEVEGKTEEAADLYQKIFNDYGETYIAEDAKSAFIVLQKKLKKEDI